MTNPHSQIRLPSTSLESGSGQLEPKFERIYNLINLDFEELEGGYYPTDISDLVNDGLYKVVHKLDHERTQPSGLRRTNSATLRIAQDFTR